MSTSRTRLLWLFLPLALVLVVSAPSAKKTEPRSGTLRFEMLDGSSEDLDGVADGVWTVPGGMILEGKLVCGEAGGNEAVASQCAMALRVEGDLELRSGGAIAAADGLELDIDGDLRVGAGSVIASAHGAVEIAARGRIEVDGLLSSGGDSGRGAGSKSRAHREPSTSIRLRSTGGPGSGIRLGASGTVLSTGAARAGGLIEMSGCGLEIHGLIASIGEGPGAGIVLRSCEGLVVDGRDLADPAGLRRGRLEVRGSGAARIDLFAQESVSLDGAELGVAGGAGDAGGNISVTADRGSLSWERGKGAAGSAGAIRLSACADVDLDGSRLAPAPEIVEACAGVEKVSPDPGLVTLPPEFSGSGLVEAPGSQASGGTCTPNLAVDNMTISTFAEFISCNVLTSSNTRIIPRGRVTFKALTAIELGNGFSVEGSSHFTAVIDPTLNQPPTILSDGGGPTAGVPVPENTTVVTDVDASDPEGDTESGGGLNYSLSGDDAASFSIDAAGLLVFVTAPDFDLPGDADSDNDYEVTVTVTDSVGLTDAQAITVTVTDVNELPTITSPAVFTIPENQTVVATLTATDPDVPAQTLTWTETGGADAALLSITAGGALSFDAAPSFEAPADAGGDNVYDIDVQVADGAGGMATQSLTITVTDVNEEPVITSSATQTAAENQTAVATLTATDEDLPAQTLTWTETGGADTSKLSITAGGVLTFDLAPDFETKADANMDGVYEIDVEVSDGAGGVTPQTVLVTVTDLNEDPTITSSAMFTIPENQASVATLTATDPDVPAQTLTWTETGGADAALLSITAGGALSFDAAPSFEAPADAGGDNVYDIDVQVADGAGGMATQSLTITVTDVNEEPVITSSATQTAAENQTAVATLTATDEDLPAQTLTWTETGGADTSKLSITAGGVLTFDLAPDFETKADADMDGVYEIDVEVSDGAGGVTPQTVLVTVTDVNEDPTITSSAMQSSPENQTAVATLTATDPDLPAQTLTWTETGGADALLLSITAGGALSFDTAPNFEAPGDADSDNVYEIDVQVADGAGGMATQSLTITVTDVNDDPVITSSASQTAAENQTAVATLTATDQDLPAQTLTWSETGGADASKLSITAGGVLTFDMAPNFEFKADANMDGVYEIDVQVSDGAGGVTPQTVLVTVTDVNENPTITSSAMQSSPENQTAVGTLTATDPDMPAQTLTWSETGGVDAALLSITAGGALSFDAAPDFESPGDADSDNVYEIDVQVVDGAGGVATQSVSVTVTNVNEAPVSGVDAFDFVGNTLLLVDKASEGTAEIIVTTGSTTGVLDNDSDPDIPPAALSITGVRDGSNDCADMTAPFTDCPTANGGKVTLEDTGEFRFVPKAGDVAASDTFEYKLSDGVNTVNITVTLNRKNRVWYVDNSNMSGTDDGTSGDPFDTLAEASAVSLPGDTIFVFEGSGTTTGQNAGIALKTMQRLLGEGVALTVPEALNGGTAPTTLFAAGNKPLVEHATAMMDGITVDATAADHLGIEIRGLSISGARNAIDVTSAGAFAVGITITDNLFDDSGDEAIDLNPGGSGDFIAIIEDNTFSTSSPTGNAIDVTTGAGAGDVEVAINNNTDITSSGGDGINIDGTLGTGTLFITGFADNTVHGNTGGTGIRILGATFDADTSDSDFDVVAAGTSTVGTPANPVGAGGVALGSAVSAAHRVSGNLSFTRLDVAAGAGTGLTVAGSGVFVAGPPDTGFQVGVTAGIALATGGPALDFDPATVNATFDRIASTSSPGVGVRLKDIDGSVAIGNAAPGSSITGATGTAFEIDAGRATVNYGGIIDNTMGFDVEVKNRPVMAGDVTFSNTIGNAAATTGSGISVANNLAGNIGFIGPVNLNTGANGAVTITSNAGALTRFAGGLDIDTTTGIGFRAIAGGTIEVLSTGVSTTVDVGALATHAVDMNNVTIGLGDVTFDSITAAGGCGLECIDLDNVSNAGTFNGGVVDINGTTSGTAGIDVALSSAAVTFASVAVDGTADQGIFLNSNTGSFQVAGTTNIGASAGASGPSILINGGTGGVTFSSVNIDNRNQDGIRINGGSQAINFGATTIDNQNADADTALLIQNTTGGSVTFSSVAIDDNGAGEAVRVLSNSAIVNIQGGSIMNSPGIAFEVDGGATAVTYSGTITNTAGRSVQVANRTGATVQFEGFVNDDGTGIFLNNNGSGTVNFRGGMALDTGANAAFTATGGGTVEVCATANCAGGTAVVNSIGATSALSSTAVNVANTTIGTNGVTFQSIDVNAGATATTGINLDTTGAGTFTVTGIDGPCGNTVMVLDCDGGTIENVTGADAVKLKSTGGRVTLKNMLIEDIADSSDSSDAIGTRAGHDGIHGQAVGGGLTLDSVLIRKISDNGVNGALFSDGISPTTWNGLTIVDSKIEDTNRFHVGPSGPTGRGDDADEGGVRIDGLTGTVLVTGSLFQRGASGLDLISQTGAGTLDITIQGSTFNNLYKEFLCAGVMGTTNVGRRGITIEAEGSHNVVARIGDPAEASDALGNTFTNNLAASIVVVGQQGGGTAHTGTIETVISRNDFIVTDHKTGPDSCPSGSLIFNHPQGGVSLNPAAGSTYEAIVSHNLFDQVMHAAGGLGQLTLGLNGGVSDIIVRNNEFKLPWDHAVQVRAEGTSVGTEVLFENNTWTDGTVGGPGDPGGADNDVGFSADSPFIAFTVNVLKGSLPAGGKLDLTIRNEGLPQHDTVFSPGDRKHTLEVEVQSDDAGNLLNLHMANNSAPEGYHFKEFAGDFNLYRGVSGVAAGSTCAVADPETGNCRTVLNDNGNTGSPSGTEATSPPFIRIEGAAIDIIGTAPTIPTPTVP